MMTMRSFLSLPAELRLMVYSHFASHPDDWSPTPEDLLSANQGILMACKAIRREALPEFHKMMQAYYQLEEKSHQSIYHEQINITNSKILGHAKVTYPGPHATLRPDSHGVVKFPDVGSVALPLIQAGLDCITYVMPGEFTTRHPALQIKIIVQYLEDRRDFFGGGRPKIVHMQWEGIPMVGEEARKCLDYEEATVQEWRWGDRDHVLTLDFDGEKTLLKGLTWAYKARK
jgi:hypothetical protein